MLEDTIEWSGSDQVVGDVTGLGPCLSKTPVRDFLKRTFERARATRLVLGSEQVESDLIDPETRWLRFAAKEIYQMRRRRDNVVPSALVGDAAWDMLLALYSDQTNALSATSVCYSGNVTISTGMRWIEKMSDLNLVERLPHPTNKRIVVIALTTPGRDLMRNALRAMLRD